MRTVLAGLWARRGLNTAIFLLAVVAVAVAMTGPLYAKSSVEHLLDSRVAERPAYTVGLTTSVPAMEPGSLPVGDPGRFEPPDVGAFLDSYPELINDPAVARYWQEPRPWLLDEGGSFTRGALTFETALYWREDMCTLAQVEGRCPSQPDEALMDAGMADTLGIAAGDTFELTSSETWLERTTVEGGTTLQERARPVSRPFTLVGTYEVTDPEAPAWFQPARFQGDDQLRPSTDPGTTPTAPALLVAPSAMSSQTFVLGVDRPIDTESVDVATMDEAEAALSDYRAQVIGDETADDFEDLDIGSLFEQVESEQGLLSRITLAATVPLIVLALLLLYVLVSAAADVRRPEVALAKLRGLSPRSVLRFAVAEPFLLVLLAAPVAVAVAYVGARLLVRSWLAAGVPVQLDALTVGAAVAVTSTALVTATGAVLAVVREPLAVSLASASRKPTGSRWLLVAQSAVVMLAVAGLVQVWSSRGSDSTTILELLAPLFVGLAVAVLGIALLGLLARWWVAATSGRGGTATYLSSRRLLRRRDMARLMVPLLLAVSVTTFAVSAWQTADDWRVSKARAAVGAPTTYLTDADPGHLMQVTHQVDPDGEYLAAAVVETARTEDTGRRVLVDTPRLAEVAAWDGERSGVSAADAERLLTAQQAGEPVTFSGTEVAVTLRDVSLRTTLRGPPELWVSYTRGDTGTQERANLGPVGNGARSTLRTGVTGCETSCAVDQVYLSGSGSSVTDAQGNLTISEVAVDGELVDWRLAEASAWRAAQPFPASLADPPVTLEAGADGLVLGIHLAALPGTDPSAPDAEPASGIARITPADHPAVPAVLLTTSTDVEVPADPEGGAGVVYDEDVVVGTSLQGVRTPMRDVRRVQVLPGLGTEGAMSDLGAALREFGSSSPAVTGTQLWVADGTPASVVDEVRAAGVTLTNERTVAGELEVLRTDAFSLGWRIFLLVGALTLLLSILGILAGAVIQVRWRSYEVAALRVVGVRRRDLVLASLWEYVVILGFSVVLGVLSAVLALKVVLPSINLGEVGEFDPLVDYGVRWPLVALVVAVVLAAVLGIAALVSARTARLGRPSTLRQAEQN